MGRFDEYLERRGTDSVKWDYCQETFGRDDVLPMWVADSDWPAPPVVIEAIKQRVEHGAFGYTRPGQALKQVIVDWVNRHYNWEIEPDWIVYSSGVVPAINIAVKTFTNPGDGVIIQSPVYYPFFTAVRDNGAQVVNNQLLSDGEKYQMDFQELAARFDENRVYKQNKRIKMLILCNPHNPVGRVWNKTELVKLTNFCLEHNILLVADEIHADLIYDGRQHLPAASLNREIAENSITMIAPSKTFNLAGLHSSVVIIPNSEIRAEFEQIRQGLLPAGNVLGFTAMQAAYSDGADWLKEQLTYLEENRDLALTQFDQIKGIKAIKPEGTYLLWLDCRELALNPRDLNEFMINKARVGLNQGPWFGPGGEGFMRMNLACPRSILTEGLKRIRQAIEQGI